MNTVVLFIIQFISSWFMCGLIWTIQVVHYKLFNKVGIEQFMEYHNAHSFQISLVVLPVMITELATALCLLLLRSQHRVIFQINLGILIAIWLSTFFIQVPLHTALESAARNDEFSLRSYELLVQSNWIRTILWSAKSALLTFVLYHMVRKSCALLV